MKFLYFILFCFSSLAWSFEYRGAEAQFSFFDFNYLEEIIGQTPNSDPNRLELDLEANDFKVQTSRKIFFSSGVIGTFSQVLTETQNDWGTIGVYPTLNTFAVFNQSKNSKNLSSPHLPTTSRDIQEWSNGDTVYYQVLGGISFNLSIGYSIFSIGEKLLLEGGFSYYIEKKSDSEVYIEIKTLKAKTLSTLAGAIVPTFEFKSAKELGLGDAYLIKMDTEQGRKAYELMIRGRIDQAREEDPSIIDISDVETIKKTKARTFKIATPFIPLISYQNEMRLDSYLDQRSDIWNKTQTSHYIQSSKDRVARFFNRQTYSTTKFQLVDTTITTPEGTISNQSTQLHWDFKSNKTTSRKLIHEKEKLINLTGLKDELDFSVGHNEKLKYSQINFSLNFSERLTHFLLKSKKSILNALEKNNLIHNRLYSSLKKNVTLDPKITATTYQHFWDSPELVGFAYELIKTCGGNLSYEVSGQRIKKLSRIWQYQFSDSCPLSQE